MRFGRRFGPIVEGFAKLYCDREIVLNDRDGTIQQPRLGCSRRQARVHQQFLAG
jgi:hypothetical protein